MAAAPFMSPFSQPEPEPRDSHALDPAQLPETAALHKISHQAMNTIMEVLIDAPQQGVAQAAAYAAFQYIDRLELMLSRFVEGSDTWRINHLAAGDWVPVTADSLDCLSVARQAYNLTAGAFDPTIGALFDAWRDPQGHPREPTSDQIDEALLHTGFDLLDINVDLFGVGVRVPHLQIDLGAIGKGFAVDRVMPLLAEWDVHNALFYGGASTVYALGAGLDGSGWPVNLFHPEACASETTGLKLTNVAVSGSGLTVLGQHIIDPRSCQPVCHHLRSWALAPSAALADALSTAFMVMDHHEIEALCRQHPDIAAMTLDHPDLGDELHRVGPWPGV